MLRALVRVGVVPRPGGSTVVPDGWRSYEIPMDPVDLSSSFIREVVPTPENLAKFIPASVIPLYQSLQG
jgi:nicotinic acid mononucleotide adenylyltransferase